MGVAPAVRNLARQQVFEDFAKLSLLFKPAEEKPVNRYRPPGTLRQIVAA